jgi:hypothetical protein
MSSGDDIADRLAEPFDATEVKWKPQSVKGNRALAICYIDARCVMDRLDEVVGPGNWQDEYTVLPGGEVVCRLSVRFADSWVTKTDVGGESEQPDEGDRVKAAFSDALKRAAVKFGIGRYLYRLGHQWCDYDPVKKQFAQKPQLPAWATPKPAGKPAPQQPPPPAPAKADPAEVGRKILAAATTAEELRAAWTTLTAHQKDVLAGLKDELKAKFAERAADPAPPAETPAEDRDGLLCELYSACEVLKTPAHQMLARHRKQVGAFPDGKPMPKVEELDLPALRHLLALVEQQADAAVEAAEREVTK